VSRSLESEEFEKNYQLELIRKYQNDREANELAELVFNLQAKKHISSTSAVGFNEDATSIPPLPNSNNNSNNEESDYNYNNNSSPSPTKKGWNAPNAPPIKRQGAGFTVDISHSPNHNSSSHNGSHAFITDSPSKKELSIIDENIVMQQKQQQQQHLALPLIRAIANDKIADGTMTSLQPEIVLQDAQLLALGKTYH